MRKGGANASFIDIIVARRESKSSQNAEFPREVRISASSHDDVVEGSRDGHVTRGESHVTREKTDQNANNYIDVSAMEDESSLSSSEIFVAQQLNSNNTRRDGPSNATAASASAAVVEMV